METPLPEPARRSHRSWRATGIWVGVLLVFFLAALLSQRVSGAYRSELSHFPDEAAHVVTSLMVRDYLASGFHQGPMAYAQNYYLHYPKVAIGMWPPVFYTVAGIWMLVFPATHLSLLVFEALLTALLAASLAWFAGELFGRAAGLAMGAALLALPAIQWGNSLVMLDVSIAVLALWSTRFLARYFADGKLAMAALYGLLAVVTMLTKGTGNAVVLVPLPMLALTGRFRILRQPGLYVAAAITVALGLPWQLLSWKLQQVSVPIATVNARYLWEMFSGYSAILIAELGVPLSLVALLGLAVESWRLLRTPSHKLTAADCAMAGALSLPIAVMVFQCIAPVPGPERRYMTPALPGLLIGLAAGLRWLARRVPPGIAPVARFWVAGSLAAVLFAATKLSIPFFAPQGFAEVAGRLARHDGGTEAMLVCSDPEGEGALITEVAWADRRPGAVVLRGSKILSENAWSGTEAHRPKLRTPAEAEDFLESVPVDSLVIDQSRELWPQDRQLLLDTVRMYPDRWRLLAEFPAAGGRHRLSIYRRAGADTDTRAKKLRLPISLGPDLILGSK